MDACHLPFFFIVMEMSENLLFSAREHSIFDLMMGGIYWSPSVHTIKLP